MARSFRFDNLSARELALLNGAKYRIILSDKQDSLLPEQFLRWSMSIGETDGNALSDTIQSNAGSVASKNALKSTP